MKEEAMIIGYLLMKSEKGAAEWIEGIRHFAATGLSQSISLSTAMRLEKKYEQKKFYKKNVSEFHLNYLPVT